MDQKFDKEWSVYVVSKYFYKNTNYKEKKSNFTTEKSGRHHFHQVIKVNIISSFKLTSVSF